MVRQGNDKLTISIDKSIKEKFKQLCAEYGLQPGKQIELLLKEKIGKLEKNAKNTSRKEKWKSRK